MKKYFKVATEGVTLRGHYLVSKIKRCTHKKKKKCKIEVACEIKDIEKKHAVGRIASEEYT